MWLVAGLGNPGPRYQDNRHNVGFMVVDELASRAHASSFQAKFGGEATRCQLGGHAIVLFKPMEFMNNSGHAVQRVSSFYKIDPSQTVIVHDEVDIEFGRLRLKSGGGHGGHNGIRSIIDQLGSRDFFRVRVGVGRPRTESGEMGTGKMSSFVLSDFSSEQDEARDKLIGRAADASGAIIERGLRAAMNDFNAAPESKKKKPKKETASPETSENPEDPS